jgi:phosphoribosylformimino-5-aminoimidazole carboxamide ribotide isomerase
MGEFLLLPAIDLRHGKVVQLVGGDPANVALERPDAEEQAAAWEEAKATWIHVVDLDAAFGERNQWSVLARLLGRRTRIQFGGGIRSMTQVQQLLELGVERVVVGTQGVLNPAWTKELCRVFPGRIVLAIDARGRDIVVKGWTQATGQDVVSFAKSLDEIGLAAFLYTNVEREGQMRGMDRAVVTELRTALRTPLLVSGGVTTMDDLEFLRGAGVAGAVLGMSVYMGKIDLEAAIRKYPQPKAAPLPPPPDPEDDGDHGFLHVLRPREEDP